MVPPTIPIPNVNSQAVTLLTCIQEVTVSNVTQTVPTLPGFSFFSVLGKQYLKSGHNHFLILSNS